MKHYLFLVGFLALSLQVQAQISMGLKGGVNTQVKKPEDIIIQNGDTSYTFGVDRFKFGTQFGAYLRFGKKIYVQPEVLFNSNRTDFVFGESSVAEVVKTERYQYLDIPVLVGVSFGPLLLHAGPVGHYYLNSRSELTDLDGYEARFKQFTWGWQGGVTIGKGRLSADLRYEGNFNKQADHVTFFGDEYHFSTNPARFLLNLNFKLF
jgi:hypothetical protein